MRHTFTPRPRDPHGTSQQDAEIRRTLASLTQTVTQLASQVERLLDENARLAERPAVAPKLLTCAEAALMLGVSEGKVRAMVSAGEIGSLTIGASRRIPVEAVDAYVSRNTQEAA